MHYFRIHPDQWADRRARAAAMGINTVEVGCWGQRDGLIRGPRQREHGVLLAMT